METLAYIRKYLSKHVTPPPKNFRNKLLDDPDVDGLELAGIDTPGVAYELREVSRSSSNSSTSTPRAHAEHKSFTLSWSAAAHTRNHGSDGKEPGGDLGHSQVSDSLSSQPRVFPSFQPVSPAADTLLQWRESTPATRLIVSVLLELALQDVCRQQVKRLIARSTWSEACNECRDGLVLSVLLQHYFQDAIDLQQLNTSSVSKKQQEGRSTHLQPADKQAAQLQAKQLPDAAARYADLSSSQQQQASQLTHPLQQLQPLNSTLGKKQQQLEQALQSNSAQQFSAAAAAAGVLLPADRGEQSIAAADPQQVMELFTTVILAGEMHQLQSNAAAAAFLQEVSQQQRSQLHLGEKSSTFSSTGNDHATWQAGNNQLPSQQEPGQLLSANAVYSLLQAWLTVVTRLCCATGASGLMDALQQQHPQCGIRETALQAGGSFDNDCQTVQQQQQQCEPDGSAGGAASFDCSWQHLVDVLLHWQQPTQQQLHKQKHSKTNDGHTSKHQRDTKAERPSVDSWSDPLTGGTASRSGQRTVNKRNIQCSLSSLDVNSNIGVAGDSISSTSNTSGISKQLQQLGCSVRLLQQQDLQDIFLQAVLAGGPTAAEVIAAEPLQTVLLLRVVSRTSHVWLPAVQQQQQHMLLQEDQLTSAVHAVPQLHQLEVKQCISGSMSDEQLISSSTVCSSSGSDREDDSTADLARTSSDAVLSPRMSWPLELLTTSQLWPGDDDDIDAVVISREERTLRRWINSLLHQSKACSTKGGTLSKRSSSSGGVQASTAARRFSVDEACSGANVTSSMGGSCSWEQLKSVVSATEVAPAGAAAVSEAGSDDLVLLGTSTQVATAAAAVNAKRNGRISSHCCSNEHPQQLLSTCSAPVQLLSAATAAAQHKFSFNGINSLFGAEIRSGMLLLELLEYLQPGCVDWRLANKLPFKMGAAAMLLALENCQLALKTAQEELGLPLVSMSPRDVVLGRRKIILSLVYQLMRYHTMQLLESIATVQSQQLQRLGTADQQLCTHVQQQRQSSAVKLAAGPASGDAAASASASPSVTPRAAAAAGGVNIFSSSKKQRRRLAISEQDILDWANSKLQQVQPLQAGAAATEAAAAACRQGLLDSSNTNGSATADLTGQELHADGLMQKQQQPPPGVQEVVVKPVIKSFKDPSLQSGLVLLQLLHVMDPSAVDMSFVTPGVTPEQRQSNAKYALSVADTMGCSLFLVWEDLVDLQPRMVLVLLASLMYLDQSRQRQRQLQKEL